MTLEIGVVFAILAASMLPLDRYGSRQFNDKRKPFVEAILNSITILLDVVWATWQGIKVWKICHN